MRKLNPVPIDEDTIIYPCEIYETKDYVILEGHPCRYILDVIDGEVFGTDSYELYNLYVGEPEPEPEHYDEINEGCKTLATPESWKKAMEQEARRNE
jgi:hypothetical protein